MADLKTPEEIARDVMDQWFDPIGGGEYGPEIETTTETIAKLIITAVKTEREQRQPYIKGLARAAEEYSDLARTHRQDQEAAEAKLAAIRNILED